MKGYLVFGKYQKQLLDTRLDRNKAYFDRMKEKIEKESICLVWKAFCIWNIRREKEKKEINQE